MRRWRLATSVLLLAVVALLAAPPALAQFGGAMMRSHSQTIDRAISRNLEQAFKPRLVITQGATGPVTSLAVSADEHYLVTAVETNSLRVWDLWAGREVARLSGHADRITAIAVAPDSSRAVSVDAAHAVRIWDLRRPGAGEPLAEAGRVSSVALTGPDRLVTGDIDGRVREWSLRDRRVVRDLAPHGPGPVIVAAGPEGRFASGGGDGIVRMWDGEGHRLAEITAGGAVTALALGGERIAASTSDTVTVWRTDGTAPTVWDRADAAISGLALAKDGQRVLSGDRSGQLALWEADSGREIRALGRHDDAVTFVALAQDGGFAVSASEDGSTRLWNLTTGTVLLTLYSTETGWAIVDAQGRYDGNQSALNGVEWQSKDAAANIEDFAENYYQAGLLPRSLQTRSDLPDVPAITDGVAFPPKVKIAVQERRTETTARAIRIDVVADDLGGGVDEIRLFRNGKAIPASRATFRREEIDGRARLVGEYEIETDDGPLVLSATAINRQRLESRPQTLALGTGGGERRGRLHFLTVGINQYRDPRLTLGYAVADAQALADFLGSGRTAMPVAQRIDLRDGQATKASILDAIRGLRQVPTEDVVVIYLAGHGIGIRDEWYFISQEVPLPKRSEDLVGIALSSDELRREIEALNAERTLLMIDACHSGAAVSVLQRYRGLKSLRLLARSVGTHILAATDRVQSAVEIEQLGHGLFTYTLLEALGGKADYLAKGEVSASGLINYVEETVPRLSREMVETEQFPTGYSRGIDFALTRITR